MPQSVLKPVSTGLCGNSSDFGGYEYLISLDKNRASGCISSSGAVRYPSTSEIV
jgi:hypothetical protein